MQQPDPETIDALQFGDLAVLAHPPATMLKALAVIAARAHPAYDECSGVAGGASKDKCLFMSLAVRDFLVEIGYRDATVIDIEEMIDAGRRRPGLARGDRAMKRQCGDSQLCCKLLPVPPLQKAAGASCRFQKFHKGCTVYHRREMPPE